MSTMANVVSLDWALSFLERVTVLGEEPVTELELGQQLRVDSGIESDYVLRLGRVAREVIERYTNRAWVEQELSVACQIQRAILPLPLSFPLRQILEVSYIDADGITQTIEPALYTLAWRDVPVTIDLTAAPEANFYSVRYLVGNDTAPPEDIRHAILALARWAFEQPAGASSDTGLRKAAALIRGQLPPMLELILEPYRMESHSW